MINKKKIKWTAKVFRAIIEHAEANGSGISSYRYLIYERLGFGYEAYGPLIDGLIISNEFVLNKSTKIIDYQHHGNKVKVRKDLLGQHKEFCLCYSCGRFVPEEPKRNCRRAQELFEFNIKNGMETPVWECPDWIE